MTSYGSEISKRNQPTQANTTGNARFANSLELLAKTPTLLAKALPTGFPSFCWKEPLAF
jgi:hypothetical protein